MVDLQELYQTIDRLSGDQLDEVTQYIEQRRGDLHKSSSKDKNDERLAQLKEGFAELRQGLSEKDLEELTWAMNVEHVNPDELNEYDWIDDLSEQNQ